MGAKADKPADRERVVEKPADFDKLPARFKSYIRALEGQIYTLKKLTDNPTPTRVRIEPFDITTRERQVRYLTEDEPVRFYTGGDQPLEVKLEQRHSGKGTRLSVRGMRQLVVFSVCGNEVQIAEEEF